MEDLRSQTSPVNGAKSAGPTSPEGKRRSSRNAEKHGLYSNAVLLQNESAEDFTALSESYYRRFLPANRPESDLVDQMIAATWRLRRLAAIEAAALDHAMDAGHLDLDATYEDLPSETRTHFAYDKLATGSGVMASYARGQSAQVRIYDRALRNLRFLRDEKPEN